MVKTFVLIQGTWHGGWAWRQVVHCLFSKGHFAHAPTLAGHGPGAARQGVTHQDCVASVVNYIRERSLSDIFVVGHSFGGTVAQKVAEQVAGCVARVIFLNAFILKDKQCVFDVLPAVFLEGLRPKPNDHPAETSSDESMQLLAPAPWETWRDNFMQGLSAEPNQVNLDSLDLKQFYSIAIPKSFIFCRQDHAMPPGYFHPGMSSRLGPHKLVEMDGSHEVMFTRPAELADKIIEASAD